MPAIDVVQQVLAIAAGECIAVISVAAVQLVIAMTTAQHIIAGAAIDDVIAAPTLQYVIATRAADRISQLAADDVVGLARAVDPAGQTRQTQRNAIGDTQKVEPAGKLQCREFDDQLQSLAHDSHGGTALTPDVCRDLHFFDTRSHHNPRLQPVAVIHSEQRIPVCLSHGAGAFDRQQQMTGGVKIQRIQPRALDHRIGRTQRKPHVGPFTAVQVEAIGTVSRSDQDLLTLENHLQVSQGLIAKKQRMRALAILDMIQAITDCQQVGVVTGTAQQAVGTGSACQQVVAAEPQQQVAASTAKKAVITMQVAAQLRHGSGIGRQFGSEVRGIVVAIADQVIVARPAIDAVFTQLPPDRVIAGPGVDHVVVLPDAVAAIGEGDFQPLAGYARGQLHITVVERGVAVDDVPVGAAADKV